VPPISLISPSAVHSRSSREAGRKWLRNTRPS
jgi:hypothetical protein